MRLVATVLAGLDIDVPHYRELYWTALAQEVSGEAILGQSLETICGGQRGNRERAGEQTGQGKTRQPGGQWERLFQDLRGGTQ